MIDHRLSHNSGLDKEKYQKIDILQCHNVIKLAINSKDISGNSLNILEFNNILLTDPYIKVEITWRIRKYFQGNDNGILNPQVLGIKECTCCDEQ